MQLNQQEKTIIGQSAKVIVPVRASRLDIESAVAVSNVVPQERVINVLSCYDKRISDQLAVQQTYAKDYLTVGYASIYARTMNDFKTIYTREESNKYGIRKAKNEITAIIENILK